MAKIKEIDEVEWQKWVKTRPLVIRELCERFPPDRLYFLTSSDHFVEIYSYSENETMNVLVLTKWNPFVITERNVFGIKPEDLVECDIPHDLNN